MHTTITADLETRRVLWATVGRDEQSLGSFYETLGPGRCAAIEAVGMDMRQPYRNVTAKYCPKAQIVFDPFHAISNFYKVIDEVRNEEYRHSLRLRFNQPKCRVRFYLPDFHRIPACSWLEIHSAQEQLESVDAVAHCAVYEGFLVCAFQPAGGLFN